MESSGTSSFIGIFVPIAVASLALVTSLASVAYQHWSTRSIRRHEESTQFLEEKLNKLYLPVSMNLAASWMLFQRFLRLNLQMV